MTFAYSEPWQVHDVRDCYFYHQMELPISGSVGGEWDLRGCVSEYLGHFDFSGKRALDVGAASGFLSFEMEKRGADVVSFDLADGANWNIVPHYRIRQELPERRLNMRGALERLKRAYWLTHRELGSRAQAYYGDIYALPKDLGEFDVVFYGMILTHLRDPFQALYSGCRLSRDAVIVTGIFDTSETPSSTFRPAAEKIEPLDVMSWWLLSIGTLRSMLGTLGFGIERIVEAEAEVMAPNAQGQRTCQAVVARRVHT